MSVEVNEGRKRVNMTLVSIYVLSQEDRLPSEYALLMMSVDDAVQLIL